MGIYDMHCDTISKIWHERMKGNNIGLRTNGFHIDLEKMKRGGYGLQCFAAYIDQGELIDPVIAANEMISVFYQQMKCNEDCIRPAFSYRDIEANERAGFMSALLTIEGAEACTGSLPMLYHYYETGVRMMTLTWNYVNELGCPNINMSNPLGEEGLTPYIPDISHGLTKRGFEFVEEMERLGMIIDVSHLSDKGFFDVAAVTKKPFVASHSNSRNQASFVRNLTDDMIRVLAGRGGVLGINYCADFLYDFQDDDKRISRVTDIIRHMKHIVNVGGIGVLGLGSDFDGISDELEIRDCSKMDILVDAMHKAGFLPSQVDCILFKNLKRVFRDILV